MSYYNKREQAGKLAFIYTMNNFTGKVAKLLFFSSSFIRVFLLDLPVSFRCYVLGSLSGLRYLLRI
jgi:hypothetical protein